MLNLETVKSEIEVHNRKWIAKDSGLYKKLRSGKYNLLGLSFSDDSRIEKIMEEMSITKNALKLPRYPIKVDWRNVAGIDWTTPIKDQGACGACVAFSVIAALESRYRISNSLRSHIDFSEAYLFFCGEGSCENGWDYPPALDFCLESGIITEGCFPYQDRQLRCNPCDNFDQELLFPSKKDLISDNPTAKVEVWKNGPIMAAMKVYEDFLFYSSGVYEYTTGNFLGNHAVCIVGYNEKEKCWICKNSWGTNWGENGWFKIRYNECGIDTEFPKYALYI